MVGMAARILVSSVMFWLSSRGTLRSALTNTLFPFNSPPLRSPTLLFAIDTTPLAPLPLTLDTLDATSTASSGSAAVNPSLLSGRTPSADGSCTREVEEDGDAAVPVDFVEERREEKVVGAAAEAIVI